MPWALRAEPTVRLSAMAQIQIAPGQGRVLLDLPDVDPVLPGDRRRREQGRVRGGRQAQSLVLPERGLDLGERDVAPELDVGHDRVGVEDGGQDDRERQRDVLRSEDPPDLGGDPVLEGREAVPLGLPRSREQVEGDLVREDPLAHGRAAEQGVALFGQLLDALLGEGRDGLEDRGHGPGDAEALAQGRQEMRQDDRGRVRIGHQGRLALERRGVVDARDDDGDLGIGVEGLAQVQGPVVLFGRQAPVAKIGLLVRGQEDEVEALEGGRGQGMDDLGFVAELAELGELLLDVGVEELEGGDGELGRGEDGQDLLALERVGADEREAGLAGLGRGHGGPYVVRRRSDISRYIRSLRASFLFLSSRSSSASAGER